MRRQYRMEAQYCLKKINICLKYSNKYEIQMFFAIRGIWRIVIYKSNSYMDLNFKRAVHFHSGREWRQWLRSRQEVMLDVLTQHCLSCWSPSSYCQAICFPQRHGFCLRFAIIIIYNKSGVGRRGQPFRLMAVRSTIILQKVLRRNHIKTHKIYWMLVLEQHWRHDLHNNL